MHKLITQLAELSGHPRRSCLRFARQMGFGGKRSYKEWSQQEIADLRRLHTSNTPRILAAKLNRPEASVRAMLRRLGVTSRIEEDRFTKYTLALLLHVRPEVIQDWIDKGWLKAHREGTEKLPRVIIKAKDFIGFCKRHHEAVLRRRVNEDRLEFIHKFVFPRDCTDLLKVRDHKKERVAHIRRMGTDQTRQDGTPNPEIQTNAPYPVKAAGTTVLRRKAAHAS